MTLEILNLKDVKFVPRATLHPGSHILLHVHKGYNYEITLDRLRSKRDVLSWLHHLSGKIWFNHEMIRDFLECCEKHLGTRFRVLPQ